jgi:hypothetical protein
MSENSINSASVRSRRIHALERAADDQRAQIRLNAIEIATGLRDCEVVKNATSGIRSARELAHTFSTFGKIGQWWRSGLDRKLENGETAFPWAVAASAGAGLWTIFRWWKQNHGQKIKE